MKLPFRPNDIILTPHAQREKDIERERARERDSEKETDSRLIGINSLKANSRVAENRL